MTQNERDKFLFMYAAKLRAFTVSTNFVHTRERDNVTDAGTVYSAISERLFIESNLLMCDVITLI